MWRAEFQDAKQPLHGRKVLEDPVSVKEPWCMVGQFLVMVCNLTSILSLKVS